MARGFNPLLKFKQLGKITTPFGGSTKQESFHPGVDIAGPSGDIIPAPTPGIVTKVITGIAPGANNFGNSVEVKDPEGNIQQYHHLQDVMVKQGQQVQASQPLATRGSSGATYSPSGGDPSNLDFRIVTAYGKYKNPMLYLKEVSKNNYGK